MAKKKKRTTRRRRTRSSRPIVLQFPKRNPTRKRRKARRRRRRNPIGAATLVNPGRLRYAKAPVRRRRRRRRNPGLMAATTTKLKDLTKPKVVLPIIVGGGLGVVAAAAVSKWVAPRVPPKALPFVKIGIGVIGMPAVNRVYKGAGPYFTGFMAGTALADWLTPLLPWGGVDDYDEDSPMGELEDDLEGLGYAEVIGALDDDDLDDLGDAGIAGDDGIEEVLHGQDGQDQLIDGLGILPPFPIPPLPPGLLRLLRRRRLLWLLRMRIPQADLSRIMQAPRPQRHAALMRLRTAYKRKRSTMHKAKGAPWADDARVQRHPMRRPRPPHFRRPPAGYTPPKWHQPKGGSTHPRRPFRRGGAAMGGKTRRSGRSFGY